MSSSSDIDSVLGRNKKHEGLRLDQSTSEFKKLENVETGKVTVTLKSFCIAIGFEKQIGEDEDEECMPMEEERTNYVMEKD